jgi:hypothetical protein
MSLNRYRSVTANQTISDQADFFTGDNFTRVTNLTLNDIALKVFWDNQLQPWTLVDGTLVANAQVNAGYVYFTPIPGATGYYSIRWRPQALGYWRVALNYASGSQFNLLDYDVLPEPSGGAETGLRASFIKP